MTFGQRITYARKQIKITQADLGKAVGTSDDIIGKYERDGLIRQLIRPRKLPTR